MAFVLGVLEATDDRGRGANSLGKLSLAEPCLLAKVVELASDFGVCEVFYVCGLLRGVTLDESLVEVFQRRGGWLSLAGFSCRHRHQSFVNRPLYIFGSPWNRVFLSTALSICRLGTFRSFVHPCETTAAVRP